MTKRARTIIFLICVGLFVLASPAAILYSQGYRLDFENRKVVKTGGFYFRVLPGRADVYINGRLEKNTAIISNSAYIKNMLPKKYEVEIKKDDYYSWKKTLEVKEKEVTEAENITLFPQNPHFSIVDMKIPKIIISATSTDKKKVIESDNYEIKVVMLEKQEKRFLTRFSERIGDIFWLNDYYLIFNVGDKIKIAEIDDRDGLNIVDLAEFSAQGGKPKIAWDKNTKKLYVLSGGILYLLEGLLP